VQTFLPYPDFVKSVWCLDYRRLGKQRVECLQILQTLAIGPYQKAIIPALLEFPKWESCSVNEFKTNTKVYLYRKTPWYNHPAARMWKGFETALAAYGIECCKEWTRRGFEDTCEEKIWSMPHTIKKSMSEWKMPDWLGKENFHLSHRSNLLRKNETYYRPIFPNDPNNLPYVWPVN
jgi:hypothetical protein